MDEQPRSQYDPTFFTTENGIKGGLTALYSHLRDTYGQAYYYNNCETGTDEYTWAQSADGNFKDADLSGIGNLTSLSCRADALWGNAFIYINTASGVIEMERKEISPKLYFQRLVSSVHSITSVWYKPLVAYLWIWVLAK